MTKRCIILLSIILLLSGCAEKTYNLEDMYPRENIVKVELLGTEEFPHAVLCTLGDSKADDFLDKLYETKVYKYWSRPRGSYGKRAVKITYSDGREAVIGEDSMHGSWYYLEEEALHELFSQYIDQDPLPLPQQK